MRGYQMPRIACSWSTRSSVLYTHYLEQGGKQNCHWYMVFLSVYLTLVEEVNFGRGFNVTHSNHSWQKSSTLFFRGQTVSRIITLRAA